MEKIEKRIIEIRDDIQFLDEKMNMDLSQLCDDRYRRFRCY